jgi:steroid 5-alpha reductase family enzyme
MGLADTTADEDRAAFRRIRHMNVLSQYLAALPWILAVAVIAWCVATIRRNAGLVDIFWSLFIVVAAICYYRIGAHGARALLVMALTLMWALRLAAHLALRNWNAPEDHRYQAIRARNEPGFAWKSLYLVFGLQAVLALLVAAPLHASIVADGPLGALDILGAVVVVAGIATEGVADAQLKAFSAVGSNRGRVMDQGLWRYSRHPNYFGEFCVWWGFFLIALGTGAWWTVISPLLMSVLLLRVSGVKLLEKDIGTRRPGYAEYVARTNAFFPGPRRAA